MNKFRIDFITSLENLKFQKTFVASKLDMTMPTLNSKVLNPEKLTLKDLSKLLELGFQIDIINILKEIKEKENGKNNKSSKTEKSVEQISTS
jgi:RNAse (barnase) inhibitor barstar